MKMLTMAMVAVLSIGQAFGQGTFVYDQQSSTDETPFPGSGGTIQQAILPWGQSFTPSNTGVGFIRLKFSDHNPGNGLGATLYVNLRTTSIGGAILDSTTPVFIGDSFAGGVNFFFVNPVPLTSGGTYYFEPVVQSGDEWNIDSGPYNYSGGTGFDSGQPITGSDLWFREGIYNAPEPSSAALILIGGILLGRRLRGRLA